MNLGLRSRIILISGAVTVFAVAATVAVMGLDYDHKLEAAMLSRSAAIGKGLEIQLERLLQPDMRPEEVAGFEDHCRDTVRNYEGISAVLVATPQGKILFHSDPARMGGSIADPAVREAMAQDAESTVESSLAGESTFSAVIPVRDRGGRHVASIVVSFPEEVIEKEVRALILYTAGVGGGLLALGVALLLAALSAFVTRPLGGLMAAMDRIRRDGADFSIRVRQAGAGEIGVLIDGFNKMLDHIQQRDTQLVSLEKLARSEASLAYAQELARVGNWEWSLESGAAYWSPQVYAILDVDPERESPTFETLMARVPADERLQVQAALKTLIEHGGKQRLEHRVVGRDGAERAVYQQAEAVMAEGRVVMVRGTLQDVTERKQTERKMRDLAYYDSLTGLPNRALFKEQLARALRVAERERERLAVMFLDLDRFKQINDSLGHSVGDQLLNEVGKRLGACLRATDNVGRDRGNDAMARLGGDEFTVLLTELAAPEDAGKVAQRIVEALARPFSIDGRELFVSASLGIAVYPGDGPDVDALLKSADVAMYSAKEQGRNTYRFYSHELNARALERLDMERDLHRALERREFHLNYQPLVEAPGGKVVGVEALLRWRHPQRGLVPPNTFIPIAEHAGLIVPIGEWVLEEACRQGQAWRESGLRLEISVNVSGLQFREGRLVETVARALAVTGFDPALLVLEATETIMLENQKATLAVLQELKALGVRVAIDDFGTGYSSLSYLKRFPLDTLKIDASFVRDLDAGNGDHAIVSAIIAMANSLGLRTLAEGVETARQAELLIALGCTRMQGYLYSRPIMPVEIPAAVRSLAAAAADGAAREARRVESVH